MIFWYALAYISQCFRHFGDYAATFISEYIKLLWYFATGTVSNHCTDLEGLLHRTGYRNIPVKHGLL